jgi:hypothetical protein
MSAVGVSQRSLGRRPGGSPTDSSVKLRESRRWPKVAYMHVQDFASGIIFGDAC